MLYKKNIHIIHDINISDNCTRGPGPGPKTNLQWKVFVIFRRYLLKDKHLYNTYMIQFLSNKTEHPSKDANTLQGEYCTQVGRNWGVAKVRGLQKYAIQHICFDLFDEFRQFDDWSLPWLATWPIGHVLFCSFNKMKLHFQ